MYLLLSIAGSLIVGFFFSLSSLVLSYVAKSGSSIIQANYDSDFLTFCIYLPIFLIYQARDSSTFDFEDLLLGSLIRVIVTTALIFMGNALKLGKAGPIKPSTTKKAHGRP